MITATTDTACVTRSAPEPESVSGQYGRHVMRDLFAETRGRARGRGWDRISPIPAPDEVHHSTDSPTIRALAR